MTLNLGLSSARDLSTRTLQCMPTNPAQGGRHAWRTAARSPAVEVDHAFAVVGQGRTDREAVAEERERLSAEHERLRRLQADTLKDAAQLREKLDVRHSRLVREQSAFDAGCARTLQQIEEQRQALRAEQAAFAEERAAYVVQREKHDANQHSVTMRAAEEEARLEARHDACREELRSTSQQLLRAFMPPSFNHAACWLLIKFNIQGRPESHDSNQCGLGLKCPD